MRLLLFLLLFPWLALSQSTVNYTWSAVPGTGISKPFTIDASWSGTLTVFAYNAPGGRSVAATNQPTYTRSGTTLTVNFSAAQTNRLSASTYIEIATGSTSRYRGYLVLTYNIISPPAPGNQAITISANQVEGLPTFLGQTDLKFGRVGSLFTDAAEKYKNVDLYTFGNSITAYGKYTTPLAAYSGMRLHNQGVSGSSLAGMNPGETGLMYNSLVDNLPTSATLECVVTLMPVINDFRLNFPLGVLGDDKPNSFYGALFRAGNLIHQRLPKAQLFFITDFGNTDTAYPANWKTNNGLGFSLAQYNQAVREVAERVGAGLIDIARFAGMGGEANINRFTEDGLHPNDIGGRVMASYIWSQIKLQDRNPQAPPPAAEGVYVLSPATVNQLSGTGLTINGINSDSTVDYTTSSSYSFQSLWLASGTNNAWQAEVAEISGSSGFWITYGDGPQGFSGVGTTGGPGSYTLTTNGFFGGGNGAVSLYGSGPTPAGTGFTLAVGDVFRVRRIINAVTIEKRTPQGSWQVILSNDLNQQTGLSPNYYSVGRLGLLTVPGAFAKFKNIKIGQYITNY